MAKPNPIFIFPSGARINLKRVISIGALDKNEFSDIVIPVFIEGTNKAITYRVGNALGFATPEQKEKIEKVYNDFIDSWTIYVLETA